MDEHRCILLTGSIDPSYFEQVNHDRDMNVVVRDPLDRLKQYEDALRRFIKETEFDYIVFTENTEYPFPAEEICKLAERYGKCFEFIPVHMSSDQKGLCLERGKSYGEAVLIREAVTQSKLIEQVESFYKITGRLFLKNSRQILREGQRSARNNFIIRNKTNWCITYFFKMRVDDYYKYFSKAENDVNDYDGHYLENIYYKIFSNRNISLQMFRHFPDIEGVGG